MGPSQFTQYTCDIFCVPYLQWSEVGAALGQGYRCQRASAGFFSTITYRNTVKMCTLKAHDSSIHHELTHAHSGLLGTQRGDSCPQQQDHQSADSNTYIFKLWIIIYSCIYIAQCNENNVNEKSYFTDQYSSSATIVHISVTYIYQQAWVLASRYGATRKLECECAPPPS
jgi:hypothetical protein